MQELILKLFIKVVTVEILLVIFLTVVKSCQQVNFKVPFVLDVINVSYVRTSLPSPNICSLFICHVTVNPT